MQKTRGSKINQIAVGFLLMLSLCASSIAACVCAHNEIHSAQKNEHCHSSAAKNQAAGNSHHVHEAAVAENHHAETFEAENNSSSIDAGECCCIKPALKNVAKFENYKIENPSAVYAAEKNYNVTRKWQALTIKTVYRAAPFYLSDSFYNISPGRAPPSFRA